MTDDGYRNCLQQVLGIKRPLNHVTISQQWITVVLADQAQHDRWNAMAIQGVCKPVRSDRTQETIVDCRVQRHRCREFKCLVDAWHRPNDLSSCLFQNIGSVTGEKKAVLNHQNAAAEQRGMDHAHGSLPTTKIRNRSCRFREQCKRKVNRSSSPLLVRNENSRLACRQPWRRLRQLASRCSRGGRSPHQRPSSRSGHRSGA